MKKNKLLPILLAVLLLAGYFFLGGGESPAPVLENAEPAVAVTTLPDSLTPETPPPAESLDEDGIYTAKEDLGLYIHTYGHLPGNFVTKEEARSAGWEGGGLDDVLPGMCIGGEGLLPSAPGRSWTECDVNTLHASSRGAERIVFSNDGLIYYTGDHYESFEPLYSGE